MTDRREAEKETGRDRKKEIKRENSQQKETGSESGRERKRGWEKESKSREGERKTELN